MAISSESIEYFKYFRPSENGLLAGCNRQVQ